MIIGTNHFVSRYHAGKYYRNYGGRQQDVYDKIENGDIKIGRPELKSGEKIVLLDDNCRYGIEDGRMPDYDDELDFIQDKIGYD